MNFSQMIFQKLRSLQSTATDVTGGASVRPGIMNQVIMAFGTCKACKCLGTCQTLAANAVGQPGHAHVAHRHVKGYVTTWKEQKICFSSARSELRVFCPNVAIVSHNKTAFGMDYTIWETVISTCCLRSYCCWAHAWLWPCFGRCHGHASSAASNQEHSYKICYKHGTPWTQLHGVLAGSVSGHLCNWKRTCRMPSICHHGHWALPLHTEGSHLK